MTAERIIVSNAPGASAADVARRTGTFIGAPITPDMTDEEIMNAPLAEFNEIVNDGIESVIAVSYLYPDISAGLAATDEGGYFAVAGTGGTYAILYREVSGSAVEIGRYPSKEALDQALQGIADVPTLRSDAGSGAEIVHLLDRKARFYKLPAPLTRREDNDGDYVIDDNGDAWQMLGRVADIRPDLPNLGQIMGEAARGAAVTIACIGDSTTDGALTTSFTQNPTAGTDPTWGVIPAADTDHRTEAPNAWPVALQSILRDHWGNANIQVWNGGYSQQTLKGTDYWAAHWFDTIFSGNPEYGDGEQPDAVLVMFGLNDMNTGAATAVADFLKGLQALCGRIRGAGAVPVVMTPISAANPNYTFRHLKELVPSLRKWCRDQGVDLIDAHDASTKYWAINGRVKMQIEVADAVHPGDKFHGFLAGYVARELCGDIRRITGDVESIGAFEVWGDAFITIPTVDIPADARYGSFTSATGFMNSDQLDAFVWIDHPGTIAVLRMSAGPVSGTISADTDLMRVRVRSAEFYADSGAVYIDRRVNLGKAPSPNNYVTDVPIEIGRLRYGLNRIRLTLPATVKMTLLPECLEFIRPTTPSREYQAHANAFVKDRRRLEGRGAVTSSVHLELPPENPYSVVSFGLLLDQVEAKITFAGPQDAGVNLLTIIYDTGNRLTYGAVKKSDGVHLYRTETAGGASDSFGVVAHASGVPDSIDIRVLYKNTADYSPELSLYYRDMLVFTVKDLGTFTTIPGGRIGGAFSHNASAAAGDVTYSVDQLRTTL